jgi:hypothetical protein
MFRRCSFLTTLAFIVFAGGCSHAAKPSPEDICRGSGPVLLGNPTIKVRVNLSPNAEKTLRSSSETLIAAAYIYGSPKPNTPEEFIDHDDTGLVSMCTAELEKAEAGTFQFEELRPSRVRSEHIVPGSYYFFVNVVSGRRSDKNNLLSCQGGTSLQKLQGQMDVPVSCSLISEEFK